MDRLGRLVMLAVLAGLAMASATAAPAQAALTGGSVTIEYSGTYTQSFVYQPSNPSVWQGSMHFNFDETARFDLPAKGDSNGEPKLVKATLTVGGGESDTLAPPNSAQNCSSTFSLRKGSPPVPISIIYPTSPGELGVHALLPATGTFVQSSDSNPSSDCYVEPSGSFGFVAPGDATQRFGAALDPMAMVGVPSNPYSKTFTANGSDEHVTQSFKSVLEITTNGKTSGPLPVKLTPAEVQAKKNALNALKETLPASLYPCIAAAAGTTLLSPTLLGIAVGGTLVAVSANVCKAYYSTVMAELSTVKDPPRGDYSVLAPAPRARVAAVPKECASSSGAARRACVVAAAASAKLLADARSTESAAKAISTTIAREVGAQHAGNRAAAARQDRHLKALGKVFAARRRTEIAAGNALAKLFHQAHASLRLSAAQSAQAKSAVLTGLAARGTPSSHIALARRLLHGGPLNVLGTLGR